MVDKPIIFSGPMARALLDGRKTQTRRVLKPQPEPFDALFSNAGRRWTGDDETGEVYQILNVPYAIGDRLWVREAWSAAPLSDHGSCVAYRSTNDYRCGDAICEGDPIQWRSPIFMPRKYSRLTLIVKEVRVQRLQEISEEDAIAEGVGPTLVSPDGGSAPHVETYIELWNSLNAKRGYPWESNPWVCTLTFDVIRQNIDALPTGSAAGM